MTIRSCQLGMIGLGQMGLGIAKNLMARGFRVIGYDLRPEANAALKALGGEVAANAGEVVDRSDVPMTSLVSPVLLEVAEQVIIPRARRGQIFIDFSTVPAPKSRRLSAALADQGVLALDAPVTGGQEGADQGTLRVCVGGDKDAYLTCLPLFEAISRKSGRKSKSADPNCRRFPIRSRFGGTAGVSWAWRPRHAHTRSGTWRRRRPK